MLVEAFVKPGVRMQPIDRVWDIVERVGIAMTTRLGGVCAPAHLRRARIDKAASSGS
jgi:hypothetical protein